MADREKNNPLSTGSVNFNFCLNRQGAQGKKGERGDEGFSPYITQGKNTLDEYTMIVTNENGSFETPNLREHKEDRGGTYYRYDRDTGIGYVGAANQATPELKGEIRIATQEDFDRLSGDTAVTPETLSSTNPLKLGYIDDRDETQTGSVAYVEYKTEITGDANSKTTSFESSFVAEKWTNGIQEDESKYYLLGQNSLKSTDGSITITKDGKTLDLSANSQGYVLPAANATTLGGIKAETKTDAETNEVKIDPATSKLYVAGGGSTPTNYVTTDTEQQITAQKEFTTTIKVSDDIVTSEGLRIANGGLGAGMVSLGDSNANLTIYSNGAPQVVTNGDAQTLIDTGNIGDTAVTLAGEQTIDGQKTLSSSLVFSNYYPKGIWDMDGDNWMSKANQAVLMIGQNNPNLGERIPEIRINAAAVSLDIGNGVKRILSEDDLTQINQDVSELSNELNQLANDVTNIESQIGSIDTAVAGKQDTLGFKEPLMLNNNTADVCFDAVGSNIKAKYAAREQYMIPAGDMGSAANNGIVLPSDNSFQVIDWTKIPYYFTDQPFNKTYKIAYNSTTYSNIYPSLLFGKKDGNNFTLKFVFGYWVNNNSGATFVGVSRPTYPETGRTQAVDYNTTAMNIAFTNGTIGNLVSTPSQTYSVKVIDAGSGSYQFAYTPDGGSEQVITENLGDMSDVNCVIFSAGLNEVPLEKYGVFDSAGTTRLWNPLEKVVFSNDVELKYGEGLSVEDGKLVAYPKNFMLKFGKTDLNESIVNTTVFALCSVLTLTDNQAFANVDPSNYNLTGATLKLPVPTALNAANTNALINYDIDVRITGTIAGSANTARDFTIELRRPNGDKIESHSVVKVATNDLNSKGVLFSTYTLGANDPFITDGFNLVLNNTSGQTITLTGVTILIKGQGG